MHGCWENSREVCILLICIGEVFLLFSWFIFIYNLLAYSYCQFVLLLTSFIYFLSIFYQSLASNFHNNLLKCLFWFIKCSRKCCYNLMLFIYLCSPKYEQAARAAAAASLVHLFWFAVIYQIYIRKIFSKVLTGSKRENRREKSSENRKS